MEKFITLSAVAAPLMRVNIDTDIIIPSREMKRVSKKGLSDGLFAGWRYADPNTRELNPDFVLNKPNYLGTQIIIAGDNFGCGSSREHAVWALSEHGIRCVIAPSFSAIFFNNSIQNGVLPIVLSAADTEALANQAVGGAVGIFFVDLPNNLVRAPGGDEYHFTLTEGQKSTLLEGLDPIDRTLQLEEEIKSFEAKDRKARPWVYI